jgi:hypothetical protein
MQRRVTHFLTATAGVAAVAIVTAMAGQVSSAATSSVGASPVATATPIADVNDANAISIRAGLGLANDPESLSELAKRTDLVKSFLGIYLTPVEEADIDRRQRSSAALPALISVLQSEYPEYYGGIGTDQKDGGIVKVVIVPGAPSAISQLISGDLPSDAKIDIVPGRYTLTQLTDAANEITSSRGSLLADGAVIIGVGVDQMGNVVDVSTTSSAHAVTASLLAAKFGNEVSLSIDDSVAEPANRETLGTYMIDGDHIHASPSNENCTAGLATVTPDGHYWITTAGHCGNGDWYEGGVKFGTEHKNLWANNTYCDCETIGPVTNTQANGRPSNAVYDTSTADFYVTAFSGVVGDESAGNIVQFSGASNGPTGHLVSATITNTVYSFPYTGSYTVNGLVRAVTLSGTVIAGDSGAPVYNTAGGNSVRADGLVSGIAGNSVLLYSPTWEIASPTAGLNADPISFTP